MSAPGDRVHDPARLAAVAATGLLDTGPERAFDDLAALAARLLDAPFAFITLVDDQRSFWKSRIGLPPDGPIQNTVEESFCQYVVRTAEPLIAGDVTANPLTAGNPSIASMGVRAWAGFPLLSPDGHPLGSFCVVDTVARDWSETDTDTLRVLAAAASREIGQRDISAALGRANTMLVEAGRHDRIVSRALQDAMLGHLPDISEVELAARYLAANSHDQVGGDWYDAFVTPDKSTTVIIGDVAGHNIAAAIVMGQARNLLRAFVWDHDQDTPAALLTRLDSAMSSLGLTTLTTALIATISPATLAEPITSAQATLASGPTLAWASAGHPMPVLLRADGHATILTARPDPPLGIGHPVRNDHHRVLAAGDTLLLFTDGLVERRDADIDERNKRLVEAVEQAARREHVTSLDAILDDVLAAMVGEDPDDDVAVLAARVPCAPTRHTD